MRSFHIAALAFALLAATTACGSDKSSGSGGSGGGAGGGGGSGGAVPQCTMPTDVPCGDEVVLQMNLQKDPAPGLISSQPSADGFESHVDATAGGAFATMPDSYVYAQFTEQGLAKVTMGDEESLTRMDWDIAFRRYVIRINSGNSGPSCVKASRTPMTTDYASLDAPPANLNYHTDDYFTANCMLIPDGSGLPDSPATALAGYWTYPGCLAMTGAVFVIELADGRFVKLIVDDYYKPDVQQECNETGTLTTTDTGSANFVIRWAFL